MGKRSIKDLLGYSFLVPVYQRGYRWTKFNVSQLLDDILESEDKEYNLQVLVLCEKKNDKIVIEGQQRITTLFLINSCIDNILLDNEQENFKIEYESRERSREFLEFLSHMGNYDSLNWKDIWEKFNNYTSEEVKENIDFRYMYQAYEVIYEKLKDIVDVGKIKNHILNDCKFMVYYEKETEGETQKIFNKLNAGKIYLTNSELIKSEYMNPNYYDENYDGKILLISKTWSDIENTLRNPDFWAFIPHENQYGIEVNNNDKKEYRERNIFKPRIDEIFQLYLVNNYGGNISEYEKEFTEHGRSKYFIYEKIKEKISDNKVDIEYAWGEVEKLYFNILELYESDGRDSKYKTLLNEEKKENRDKSRINIYNLTAYLIYMYADVQKNPVLKLEKFIIELLNKNRDIREEFLKQKIKEGFCKLYEIDEKQIEDKEKVRELLGKKKYIEKDNKNNKEIQNLFMLFNIILLQRNSAISNRYDFLNYRYWTIEHIYSQNETGSIYKESIEKTESELSAIEENMKKIGKELDKIDEKYKKNLEKCKPKDREKIEEICSKEKRELENKKQKEEKKKREKEEELMKAIKAIPVLRREIIRSLAEYYDEEKEEKEESSEEKEKKKRDINLLNALFDVIYNLDAEENKSKDLDNPIIKEFLSKHKVSVSKEFIDKYKKNNQLSEKEFMDHAKKYFNFNEDVKLEGLKSLHQEIEKAIINNNSSDNHSHENQTDIQEEIVNLDEIYARIEKELSDLYDKNILQKFENRKSIYEEKIDDYFKKDHNKYLGSDYISNLTLLRQKENRKIANEYLTKKERISEFISEGTAIPYSTLLVFTDRYLDVRKINNGERWQWLWGSRKKYFNDILDSLLDFFKQ